MTPDQRAFKETAVDEDPLFPFLDQPETRTSYNFWGPRAVGMTEGEGMAKVWNISTDGEDVTLTNEDGHTEILFTWDIEGTIKEVSGCFDQLGFPLYMFMVYEGEEDDYEEGVSYGDVYAYYYDSPTQQHIEFPIGQARCVQMLFDLVHDINSQYGDYLVLYVKDGSVCARVQRDRLATEYKLFPIEEEALFYKAFLNKQFRLQFDIQKTGGLLTEKWIPEDELT